MELSLELLRARADKIAADGGVKRKTRKKPAAKAAAKPKTAAKKKKAQTAENIE